MAYYKDNTSTATYWKVYDDTATNEYEWYLNSITGKVEFRCKDQKSAELQILEDPSYKELFE